MKYRYQTYQSIFDIDRPNPFLGIIEARLINWTVLQMSTVPAPPPQLSTSLFIAPRKHK